MKILGVINIVGAGFAGAVAMLSMGSAGASAIGSSSRDAMPGLAQLQYDSGTATETIQFRGGRSGWDGGGDAAAAAAAIGIIGGVMGAIAAQQEEERMQRAYDMQRRYE